MYQNFISFCDWILFHFMSIRHFVYALICWQTLVSWFWLLWIMPLWTLTNTCLSLFSIFSGIYLGVELLGRMVIQFSLLRNKHYDGFTTQKHGLWVNTKATRVPTHLVRISLLDRFPSFLPTHSGPSWWSNFQPPDPGWGAILIVWTVQPPGSHYFSTLPVCTQRQAH